MARRSQLVTSSAQARDLLRAVERGSVVKVAPGVYALPGIDPNLLTACVHRARVTCVTAASLHGLPVLTPASAPHLTVPRSRGRTASPARREWPAVLHREDGVETVGDGSRPLVSVPDALARMLSCRGPVDAIVAIDSALAGRLVTVEEIAARVRGPRQVGARLALRQADARSQSPIETVARLALMQAGLRVEPGVRIAGVGWVDLVVEGRVVVELDGFAYHSGRAEYREDRRRDRELVRQGYLVLRFTYEDVMRSPSMVVRAVQAVLTAQG